MSQSIANDERQKFRLIPLAPFAQWYKVTPAAGYMTQSEGEMSRLSVVAILATMVPAFVASAPTVSPAQEQGAAQTQALEQPLGVPPPDNACLAQLNACRSQAGACVGQLNTCRSQAQQLHVQTQQLVAQVTQLRQQMAPLQA